MIDAMDFKRGMRRLASGVSLITTVSGEVPLGFAATAVTSVAAEPEPTMLVCVNKKVSCHDALIESGVFCVNLLAASHVDIAKLFSSSEHRTERFGADGWIRLSTGAPVLSNALVSFDCKVTEAISKHSHTVVFGKVVDLRVNSEAVDPLLYADGRFDGLRHAVAA